LAEALVIHAILLCISDDHDALDLTERSGGKSFKRGHTNEDGIGGKAEGLGRHDADAQARVTSRAQTDHDMANLGRSAARLAEHLRHCRCQVPSMAARLR